MRLNESLLILLLRDLEGHDPVNLSGYDEETLLYHKAVLLERKLAKGSRLRGDDQIKAVVLTELTYEGHKLLNELRDETGGLQVLPVYPKPSDDEIVLTSEQAQLIRWVFSETVAGRLDREFLITWSTGVPLIANYNLDIPKMVSESNVRFLDRAGLLLLIAVDFSTFKCSLTPTGVEARRFTTLSAYNQLLLVNQATPTSNAHQVELVRFIDARYTMETLQNLCFEVNVDFDNLPGTIKKTKARELVRQLDSQNRLSILHEALHNDFGQLYEDHFQ